MKKTKTLKNEFPIKTAQLAELFSVSPRTLKNWKDKGLPQVKHGTYDLYSVFEWHLAITKEAQKIDPKQNAELADSQKKYWEAKAEREKIKVNLEKGEMVKIKDIEKDCFDMGRQVKHSLKIMIEHLAPVLAAETNLFSIKQSLQNETNKTLENLYLAIKEIENVER